MRLFILVVLLLSLTVTAIWGQETEPEILLNLYVFGGETDYDDGIVRLTQDGLEILTFGGNMAISPDGNFLAYNVGSFSDTSVEVFNLETGVDAGFAAMISDLREQGYRLWAPFWSPDGQRLAVFAIKEGRENISTLVLGRNEFVDISIPGLRPQGWYSNTQLLVDDVLNISYSDDSYFLWLVNIEAGVTVTRLAQRSSQATDEPAVGPDGTILYTDFHGEDPDYHDISLIDIMSLRPGSPPQLFASHAFGPVWSPDGRQIAYVTNGDNYSVDVYSGGVWIADADGGNAHLVYRTDHPGSYHGDISWNNDRLYFVTGIVVSSQNADEAMGDTLVSVRTDGQDYQVVYDGGIHQRYMRDYAIR